MPQKAREYRMILGHKHHQCRGCLQWKASNVDNFGRSGQGGTSYRGICRLCEKANVTPPEYNPTRDQAIALATRAIEDARERSARLAHYKRPDMTATVTDAYAPSIFDISTAPPLGFIVADYDATLGLHFPPIDPNQLDD